MKIGIGIVFDITEKWRMLVIPDWRLEGLGQIKIDSVIVFDFEEAWRMLVIPDWRLEGLGQVEL